MDSLERFWELVESVWTAGILGVDFGRILIVVVILLFCLQLRRLFTRVVLRWLRALARRSEAEINEDIIDALGQPLSLVPLIFGLFVASEYLDLTETLDFIALSLIKSLIIVVIFWSLYRLVDPLSHFARGLERVFNAEMVNWLVRATKVAFVFVGVAAILETWGIQVAPILAGLGIIGVAVALGAQDLFKNLIAGLLVIGEQRFSAGDWILVDGVVEGTVEKINFRSTHIRRFDRSPVHVPNSMLSDAPLTNFSRMTHRRIKWMVGVEYRTTVTQLRQIRDEIEEYIVTNPEFASPDEVSTFVHVDSFNDSSIDLLIYCFTVSTKWGEWLKTKEQLAYKIMEIVEKAGTGFAFPSRSLYVETMPGDVAERFIPPAMPTIVTNPSLETKD